MENPEAPKWRVWSRWSVMLKAQVIGLIVGILTLFAVFVFAAVLMITAIVTGNQKWAYLYIDLFAMFVWPVYHIAKVFGHELEISFVAGHEV